VAIGLRLERPVVTSLSRRLSRRRDEVRGFTLLELLMVVAIFSIVSAMAVPALMSSSAQIQLASATRQVERELQQARMRAVRGDRTIRIRFNCPGAGQYRMVEVLGTFNAPAVDDADARAAQRCSETNYPYPDPNTEYFAIPNNDGPLKTLPAGVAFSASQTLDFWPNGTVHAGGQFDPLGAPATLRLYDVKKGTSFNRAITVNGLGKITYQQ
jgi:prepilin-type N-terminal cleavage/methylation domain-containing protein